jgi:uncharacterized protein DUF998
MPKVKRTVRLAGQGRRLLRCGMWAGPVFTATFVAEGAVRDGYQSMCLPVSSLALGPRGWIQTANFTVAGVLCLAGAAGLRLASDRLASSRTGPVMVAAAGVGLLGSAAFRTDPVGGYPPGTPDVPAGFSRTGGAHNLAAVPVFLGLSTAAAAYGRRSWQAGQPRFAVYCAATAVTIPVTAALAGAGFGQSSWLGSYGGLFQRASIIAGFGWLTAASARALRRVPADPAGQPR